MASNKLYFDENTPKEQYTQLLNSPVGTIFKVDGAAYETIMERLYSLKENDTFEVFPITPGTDLYTLLGPDHLLVVSK